jgi:hypothetical protein
MSYDTGAAISSETLLASLTASYPDRAEAEQKDMLDLAPELVEFGYRSIDQVDTDLRLARDAALALERDSPPAIPGSKFSPVGLARMALSIANPAYADHRGFNQGEYARYRATIADPSSSPRPVSSSLGQSVDSDSFIDFLRAGINRVYPGKWQDFSGGFGTAIEVDGLGIHVLHHEGNVGFAAGILSEMRFSPDLVRAVSKKSCASPLGALTLREGQSDYWSLTWGMKLQRSWLDPSSRGTARLVVDVLTFIPECVRDVTKDLQPYFGGRKFGTEAGWWLVLLQMY